jgi:hypothetical protein
MDGANPMSFPVWCRDRRNVQRSLFARGIMGYRWWGTSHPALDLDRFPEAQEIRRHVLATPIHPGLDDEAPEFISSSLSAETCFTQQNTGGQ